MTVAGETARSGPYTGNGSTTVFAYGFKALDQTHLVVTLTVTATGVETVQTLTTHYTVSGVDEDGGGNVTMVTAPASTETLTITRAIPQTQLVDLQNRGATQPNVLETMSDRLTQQIQDFDELYARVPRFPVSSTETLVELPGTLTPATTLIVNAAGDGFDTGPSSGTISGAEASATAAAASAAAAATSYDNFDDRYLGQKSSDPSVDNDGGSLITGALYFNTSNNVMMVYTGSAWVRTTPTSSDQTAITAVNANASNINSVAGIASNVTTVAGVSANVTTVAGIASDVTAVAGDATDIGAVAGKATEIGRLGTADAVADMNTLGTAAIVTDMDLLATSANVTAMGLLGTSGNVTAMGLLGVSGVITDMDLLGTSDAVSDMNTLGTSGNVTNMNTLAGIAANVTTVAGIAANVTTTAGISSDVTTVAGIAGDVTAVAAQVVGYDFSTTTTMGDPGSGNVRFNHATLSSVSAIAIDDVDKNGVDQSAFIILWDDSTNTVKGTLVFRTAGGDVATFLITGLTDNSGWSQIAVTHVASSGTFANGEDTFIGFTRAGDKGADGAGAGDVVGPGSATDNTVARYNSTTGKLIQGSGVTIDDSNNVGAASLTLTTDLAVAHGGTGGSTASAARSNLGAAALGSNSDITALTGLTTDLSVAQGGTGASTHTANSVLIGAGTSAITSVSPSTSGNVLTSDGSAWTSATPSSSPTTVGLQSFYLGAGSFIPRVTNGPSAAIAELGTNDVMIHTLDFATGTEEGAGIHHAMADKWDKGTVTAQFHWTAASGSGGVAWSLGGVCVSNDDPLDAARGTAVVVVDTFIAANDHHVSAATGAITIAGSPADDDLLYLEVKRVVANGGDTLGVDAKLLGVTLYFTTDAAVDG